MSYEFTVILKGRHHLEEIEDRIFNAGCDDALLCSTDRTVFLRFDREADSALDAIASAINDVCAAGFSVESIEEAGFVSMSQAAKRVGMSRSALSIFIKRHENDGNWPQPVYAVDTASPLYRWSDVASYLVLYKKLDEPDYYVALAAADWERKRAA